MTDVIEPSWSVFGRCERCGALPGRPCQSMRGVPPGYYPNRRTGGMRNPHPRRPKLPRA